MNSGELLARGASWALSPGDRILLPLFTTTEPNAAIAAWSDWKRAHPLDGASSRELRVLPAVTKRLLALGVKDPDLGRMRGITRFQWLWTQRVTRASLDAARILREEGQDVVALKGLALHALGLSSPAERPITDGDLLVSGDLASACRRLAAEGWRASRRQRHAWVFTQGPQRELDVHRYSVQQDPRSHLWTFGGATRSEQLPFGVPAPAHLVVQACWHGARGAGSLLWVLDVMRVIERTRVEWKDVVDLARERRFGLLLADALGAVGSLVPEWALRELRGLPVSPLEALEYADATGCSAGPWTASLKRAALSMRELRRRAEPLDESTLAAEQVRVRADWDPAWPEAWRRRRGGSGP